MIVRCSASSARSARSWSRGTSVGDTDPATTAAVRSFFAIARRGRDRRRDAAGSRPSVRCSSCGRCAGSAGSRTACTSGTGRSTCGWCHSRVASARTARTLLRLALTFARHRCRTTWSSARSESAAFRPRTPRSFVFAPAVAVVAAAVVVVGRGRDAAAELPGGRRSPSRPLAAAPADRAAPRRRGSPPTHRRSSSGVRRSADLRRPATDETAEAPQRRRRRGPPSRPTAHGAAHPARRRLDRVQPLARAAAPSATNRASRPTRARCSAAASRATRSRRRATRQITPHTERCRAVARRHDPAPLRRLQPDVVVWMSIWEKSDLVVDGEHARRGHPEW